MSKHKKKSPANALRRLLEEYERGMDCQVGLGVAHFPPAPPVPFIAAVYPAPFLPLVRALVEGEGVELKAELHRVEERWNVWCGTGIRPHLQGTNGRQSFHVTGDVFQVTHAGMPDFYVAQFLTRYQALGIFVFAVADNFDLRHAYFKVCRDLCIIGAEEAGDWQHGPRWRLG